MSLEPQFAVYKYTLQPGQGVTITALADFVTCLSSTTAFDIQFDGSPETTFQSGLSYDSPNLIKQTRIANNSDAAIVVEMGFGTGGIKDSRLALTGTVDTRVIAPPALTTGAPVACANAAATLIAAQDANRRELLVINDGGGKVYIGGNAGALAGHGLPLAAGAALTLAASGAVYARNDSGAPVMLAVAGLVGV